MDTDPRITRFAQRELSIDETVIKTDGVSLPIVIEPLDAHRSRVFEALREDGAGLRRALERQGAILIRGAGFTDPPHLAQALQALGFEPAEYPFLTDNHRAKVAPGVVNASSTNNRLPVTPHSEQAFSRYRPSIVAFLCLQPAPEGGETPVHDLVATLSALPPSVRQKLYGTRFVKETRSMSESALRANFGTTDRLQVATLCKTLGLDHEWQGDRLSIRLRAPCLVRHPVTEEIAITGFWTATSLLDFFRRFPKWAGASRMLGHVARVLDARVFEFLITRLHPFFRRDYRYSFETNGSRRSLSVNTRLQILDAIWANTVVFRWKQGDLLLLDNLKVGHSRMPYTGSRRVLASVCNYVDMEPLMPR